VSVHHEIFNGTSMFHRVGKIGKHCRNQIHA